MNLITNATETIEFRGSMRDCIPRILWQRLFDFYREHGGKIDHMDNMLIYYQNCLKLADSIGFDGEFRFLFGMVDGHWMTTWRDMDESQMTVEEIKLTTCYDHWLLCTVTSEEATFKIV